MMIDKSDLSVDCYRNRKGELKYRLLVGGNLLYALAAGEPSAAKEISTRVADFLQDFENYKVNPHVPSSS